MQSRLALAVAAVVVCFSLSACGGSKTMITEPVGRVQLGMTVEEVTQVLGSGQVVEPAQSGTPHAMEVREYASDDGRIYVVRFVDGIVRRWELRAR